MGFPSILSFICLAYLSGIFGKFTTSLTNGIIGQISHLYSHKCLTFDSSYAYFGSCLLSNNNNLFQILYYDPSSASYFFLLTYKSSSSGQNILYLPGTTYMNLDSASNYCLTPNWGNCYYYSSTPSQYYQFYVNFTKGIANTPSGTFTLKSIYHNKCISYDVTTDSSYFSIKTCDPNDLTQIFGFLTAETYLMNQITSLVDTTNTTINIQWSNPNKIDNVDYMVIPGNQTLSDQGTINLQNVKCTTGNGLSPISFQVSSDKSSVKTSLNLENLKSCNIYSKSNQTYTTYEMKAIHVYRDNSVGFSRTIKVYFMNTLEFEQMYLVGISEESSEQTQVFESSVSSFEIVNKISMNFPDSIGQTYLQTTVQNLTISLNSSSKYTLSLVGNSMSLVSVNSTTNQVIYQTLPCTKQISGINFLNATFDFSTIKSNYYKFKITVKLTSFSRLLQASSSSNSNTVAEFNSNDVYFIGSEIEIKDLIAKLAQQNQVSSKEDVNNSAVIALSIILSLVGLSLIAVIIIWKKKKSVKSSGKKLEIISGVSKENDKSPETESQKNLVSPPQIILKEEENREKVEENKDLQSDSLKQVEKPFEFLKNETKSGVGIFIFDD